MAKIKHLEEVEITVTTKTPKPSSCG